MEPLAILNGVLSLVAAVALATVVLNPHSIAGLAVKAGLVVMIFALLASAAQSLTGADTAQALWRSGFVLRAGLVAVCVAVLLRHWRGGFH